MRQNRFSMAMLVFGIVFAMVLSSLPLLSPITVEAAAPNQPSNVSPADGTTDISLTPTLRSSAFSDPDVGDTHAASRWQITTTPGDYSSPVFESGHDTVNLYQISIPAGLLSYNTTYHWRVRHQDSYSNWSDPSTETSFTTTTLRKWTFMVYLDADNNLESAGIDDFNEMEVAGSTSDVNIVVLMDRIPGYDTSNGDWETAKLFYVTQDADPNIINSTEIADWGEVNMAHPNTLEDFATWTIENYPAKHYALILWDHGDVRGVCWDDTTGNDYLTDAELKQALRAINANTGITLDILSFDACLMGMAEIDYQIRDYANIRVGSEDLVPGDGWPYDDILQALTADPNMKPTGLASQIVNDYIASYAPAIDETQSAVRLSDSATLAGHVSDFAQSMTNSGEWDVIAGARADAEEFKYPDYDDGYVDLYHFASLVYSRVSDTTARTDAQDVMTTINNMVLAEAHGMVHSNARGISIFFPESESAYWAEYLEGMDFAADTQWDDFLMGYRTAVSGKPNRPINVSPSNEATDISLTHIFRSSPFSDPDGHNHYASQWQITTTSGDYTVPAKVYDSGIDTSNLVEVDIPSGTLSINTTYYWRVRYQDDTGTWSLWSIETSFTSTAMQPPCRPTNSSPADGTVDISLTPTLISSDFVDPNVGDTHAASQWQITTTSGDYTSPLFDSGRDSTNKTSITIPSGTLNYNTTYYWRVRHQDSYGRWSGPLTEPEPKRGWSTETSFTTVASGAPAKPSNVSPIDGAIDVSLTPTLRSSAFSDPDVGDTHAASRWQIRTDSGDYSSPLFDSGTDSSNLTQIEISSDYLESNRTYYWRVRYQDSYGNWSDWSSETSFTTMPTLPPNQPVNTSPVNGATGVNLNPTLKSSPFSDPDADDTHTASQWQITTTSGDYSSPVFDSGIDTSNLTQTNIPSATLSYNSTYHWHVKYQDSYANWSGYSLETSFTTIATEPPVTPSNSSPANAATNISLTPTLTGSAFSDPDPGDTHAASQWQITATSGDYSSPVYDSGTDTSSLTQINIPSGTLSYNTTYYWHVRYQDSYGNWSNCSTETSFAARATQGPYTPSNSSPANAATGIGLTPTLVGSTFSDPDAGDTHTASQWQITSTSADYSSPVHDSGTDVSNLTQISIPSGTLSYNTTYYWRVRYQDSYGNWSNWSSETSFKTLGSEASFSFTPTQPKEGETVTFTDLSTRDLNSWIWDFGDGNTAEWTTETRPQDGKITHVYSDRGSYTVSLEVSGPAGEHTKLQTISVTQVPTGLAVPIWVWIVVGVVVLIGVSVAIRMLRS